MRVAIVHEWLTFFAGSEKVLAEMLKVFPDADLFAVVDFLPDDQRPLLGGKHARTTFIQKLPRARAKYRSYLPLMPLAIEQLDVTGYDLVISNSHAVAKGVLTAPHQLHVCLCHSPIRYAWDLQHQYLRGAGLDRGIKGMLAKTMLHYIRQWDARTANGVDRFIAISQFVAGRIAKAYRRESTLLPSPIEVAKFPLQTRKGSHYLAASRMVPYKRMDMIVRAFRQMPHLHLRVAGDGPHAPAVRREAKGAANIEFLGVLSDERLAEEMGQAGGFVFAAVEDFGLMPLEAMATGTPVIALNAGGTRETVLPGKTGVLYDQQTPESLIAAVEEFQRQRDRFRPADVRAQAERFDIAPWREKFRALVMEAWESFRPDGRG
ncbi:MAG: glycosyltransferase [Phycisphaerae bacterium]